MNYAERITELERLKRYPALRAEAAAAVINQRIVELRRALNEAAATTDTDFDGYITHPVDTTVYRVSADIHMCGRVAAPTRADVDRCFAAHGLPRYRDPMVLVQWGVHRSWEYTQDLRIASQVSAQQ